MGDPKPIASLSGSLLARKGQAAPAMRRQSMLMAAGESPNTAGSPLEDLGWNDMGEPSDHVRSASGLTPMPATAPVASLSSASPHAITPEVVIEEAETPAVVRQQEELARELATPVHVEPVAPMRVAQPIVETVEAEEAVVEDVVLEEVVAKEAPVEITPVAPQPVAVRGVTKAKRAPGSQGKAAFTLRLDAERHLKLRLVCAVNHRSAQHIVTAALDAFLANQPSLAELASGLKA